MYKMGEGVPLNERIAMKWYKSSANQGSKEAQIQFKELQKKATSPGGLIGSNKTGVVTVLSK